MYFLDDVFVGDVSKLTNDAGDIVSIFNNGGTVLNNITLKLNLIIMLRKQLVVRLILNFIMK